MNRVANFRLLFFFVLVLNSLVYSQKSDSLVQAAWNTWDRNDQKEVEKLFRQALKEDHQNARAYFGLSYLYTLQENYDKAWEEFYGALQNLPDTYPYIFSAWITPKFRYKGTKAKSEIIKLLESLADEPGSKKYLQAAACDLLGEYYESKQKLSKAIEYYNRQNTINEWMLIGPFENISASGFEKIFPPEIEYNPTGMYDGKSGTPVCWFNIPAIRNDKWIDLTCNFNYRDAVYYGNTFVYSPMKQLAWVRIGTSGSLKAFLNDELIIDCFDENNNDLDTYITETELQAGWNRLLIKCGYSEITECNYKVRITDTSGSSIQGLRISTDQQRYKSNPSALARQIPNFAEEFFKQKIEANPKELENYLFLSDCYLRNDKAIEAELVLRKAMQFSPNCAIFYEHILEAYSRGKKYDERSQALEKIAQLDKQIPAALSYHIDRHIQNEEYDEAERLIEYLDSVQRGSENVLRHKIDLYSKRKQVEKFIETINLASSTYPENWNFIYLKAYITFQLARKPLEAVGIIEEYLKKDYNRTALYYLADFYIQSSDMGHWEQTTEKLLELQPASPGYRYRMAEIYTAAQELGKADQAISEAIRICPGSTLYWNKEGDILRMKNDRDGACAAYREALRVDQSNHDAREALRKLENKGSIYLNFEPVDIDSLIKNAPSSNVYPNDAAVFLLDDTRRIVYERGASEYVREILIKVYNSRGIDAFKEYNISFNEYNEKLNIDKAVVVKLDGSEVKADVNENQIVFKSLEPNDVIHLKFRIKKLYAGRLAKHFWDIYHFNYFYPIKSIRYSLLVQDSVFFQHTTQNMADTPHIRKTEDGTLYSWSLIDEPAIEEEPSMPPLDEIGKVLHVSSIESWQDIINWYTDIAQTKTRTSYEIKEQVDKLFQDLINPTDEQKVRQIYNFITEHIRYSSVSFRQSGLIPQKARNVLVNKIGDCKDVATLCIAMLREVGIKAHYVLMNTRSEGTSPKTLPSINFNHCIVAVELPVGLQFCDLTAHYHSFKTLPDNDAEGFYLLVKPDEKGPHYCDPKYFPARNILRAATFTLKEDNSAVVEKKSTMYGAANSFYRESFQNKSRKEQEEELVSGLMQMYSTVKLDSFELKDVERKDETTGLNYTCEVSQLSSDAGEFKILKLPWTDAFEKWSALSRDVRRFPLRYWIDIDTVLEEITIRLPKGYKVVDKGSKVRISHPVIEYSVDLIVEKSILKGRRRVVYKKSIIVPEEYEKFREFYNKVIAEDGRQILLKKR